jgi:phosphopentomutase
MKRALCIVLDSVGCGGAPDAAEYGDSGSNTLGHLFERIPGFSLPNLARLGLSELLDLPSDARIHPGASWAKLTEKSAGKDTTTGHWELMGCGLDEAFATFEKFPAELVAELESRGGVEFIGNRAASGTEILTELGGEHFRSGKPILYTSADSVLQIAAHEERFGLERLWELCKTARLLLDERGIRIGRVIARPFLGDAPANFKRTGNRHDYSLMPGETVLNRLQAAGVQTIGVGKIADIFANSGISESHPTQSNAEGMAVIARLWAERRDQPHFIFANLVDFDSLYGHRRDPEGYAQCLREFDDWLGGFIGSIGEGERVILTADHGNDPYHPGTDHTREQVPVLALGRKIHDGGFAEVARWLEEHFCLRPRVVILMGVAGCGKSTIGALLATRNGGRFFDADAFHPAANIAKMAAGTPLDDADRKPWLARLRSEVVDTAAAGSLTVLACSALKKSYREPLGVGTPGVALIYLKGDPATLAGRLAERAGHYMKAGMLESQLATLEEPSSAEAIRIGIESAPGEIVARIGKALGLGK